MSSTKPFSPRKGNKLSVLGIVRISTVNQDVRSLQDQEALICSDLTPPNLIQAECDILAGSLREKVMKRQGFSAEQIVNKLRQAEVLLSQGQSVAQVSKALGVAEQTYYRWRKEYGGVKSDQARRFKDLERENARLKRLLAEAELDKAILREAANPNF